VNCEVVAEDMSETWHVLVLRRVTLSLGCDDDDEEEEEEEEKCDAMPVRVITERCRRICFKPAVVDESSRH
jgi:hypothetical protein